MDWRLHRPRHPLIFPHQVDSVDFLFRKLQGLQCLGFLHGLIKSILVVKLLGPFFDFGEVLRSRLMNQRHEAHQLRLGIVVHSVAIEVVLPLFEMVNSRIVPGRRPKGILFVV